MHLFGISFDSELYARIREEDDDERAHVVKGPYHNLSLDHCMAKRGCEDLLLQSGGHSVYLTCQYCR